MHLGERPPLRVDEAINGRIVITLDLHHSSGFDGHSDWALRETVAAKDDLTAVTAPSLPLRMLLSRLAASGRGAPLWRRRADQLLRFGARVSNCVGLQAS